jgi:EAL domain-containing protein (putative c-di-GMP-specific phosphodiesterase class I)
VVVDIGFCRVGVSKKEEASRVVTLRATGCIAGSAGRSKVGRSLVQFFDAARDTRAQEQRALELDLHKALAAGEFELHYQPVFNLERNRISSVEALIRWGHPEKGIIAPSAFIPQAEETGLIKSLGEWVLATACSTAMGWPENVKVSVNVSPVQFREPGLAEVVVGALGKSGLKPARLELEVTEAVALDANEATLATLQELDRLGVHIALDDFGVGYSALAYLLKFPFDKIKIDRSFVWGLGDRMHADAIIRSVLDLGHSLGMEVCAEGVETPKQLEFLRQEGCDEVQGFLLSRPIPAEEFERTILPTGVLPVPTARVPAQREMASESERLGTVVAHDLGTYSTG